jgi:ABC-type Na+ efflux pump permease subunit
VSLATVANAVANLSITGGGLTNGGATSNSGAVIVRKVVATSLNGAVSSAYVTITTSNDGNASNAVVANVALSNLTGVGRYQDLPIAAPYNANTVVSGATTSWSVIKTYHSTL